MCFSVRKIQGNAFKSIHIKGNMQANNFNLVLSMCLNK